MLGGCHLNRQITELIEQAGFSIERLEHAYLKGAPKFAGFLYRGVAKRPGMWASGRITSSNGQGVARPAAEDRPGP